MIRPANLSSALREWGRDLGVAAAIGGFLGIVGPYGSFNGGPMGMRILYWVTTSCIALIVLTIAVRLSLRACRRFGAPNWIGVAAGVALGAIPLLTFIVPFSVYFWPGVRIDSWLSWYGQTLAVAEPAGFFYYFIVDGRRLGPARSIPVPIAPPRKSEGRFLDRLPARLGRNLLCLQMEDHYVRAHTDLGSDLILTPLRSAMAELAEIDGLQVHRSWWVARSAVTAALVDGRKHSLRLTNGLNVPVSRTSVAKLRAMGWLEGSGANQSTGGY
jgi:hypothetical protein